MGNEGLRSVGALSPGRPGHHGRDGCQPRLAKLSLGLRGLLQCARQFNARRGCYVSICEESHRVCVVISRRPITLGMVSDALAMSGS